MIGQAYSTSNNACMIKFIGGPYNEQEGLFDSDQADEIHFSHCEEKVTHVYKPFGRKRYAYVGPYPWSS